MPRPLLTGEPYTEGSKGVAVIILSRQWFKTIFTAQRNGSFTILF